MTSTVVLFGIFFNGVHLFKILRFVFIKEIHVTYKYIQWVKMLSNRTLQIKLQMYMNVQTQSQMFLFNPFSHFQTHYRVPVVKKCKFSPHP